MERSAKKMLNFIKTDECCKRGYCPFAVFYKEYCKYAECTQQEAMACIRYLESNGYIRFAKDQHGRNLGIELEHKARHSAYFTLNEKWLFLRNSVIVPAIVAFITAAIATDVWPTARELLYDLWQVIREKLQ